LLRPYPANIGAVVFEDSCRPGRRRPYRARNRGEFPPPGFQRNAACITDAPGCAHTFSNGSSIWLGFLSSHAGTGRFLERMNCGLNSFD